MHDVLSLSLSGGCGTIQVRRDGEAAIVRLPPLEIHAMLVGEFN